MLQHAVGDQNSTNKTVKSQLRAAWDRRLQAQLSMIALLDPELKSKVGLRVFVLADTMSMYKAEWSKSSQNVLTSGFIV